MKSALWLAFGVAIGFVVAHQVNRTPQGRAFFTDLDARTREFTDGIVDGYRTRGAELRDGADAAGTADGAATTEPTASTDGAAAR